MFQFQILSALKFVARQVSTATAAAQSIPLRIPAWQIHSYGDLSEIQLTQARAPIISDPTSVLVQVEAASLNPIDKMIVAGYGRELLGCLRGYDLEFPLTLGRDFAGTIIDKGHGVGGKFKVGDAVYGSIAPHEQGSLAKEVLCNKQMVCHRPSEAVSAAEATSLVYAGMTAWSALFLSGGLTIEKARRSKILILGASGGVGTVAMQMLKALHATVVGTCSEDAVPLVKSLGADCVFNYKDKDFISDIADVARYDIIMDCAQFGYQNIPSSWMHKTYITLNSPLLRNADKYGVIGGLTASARDIASANLPAFLQGRTVRWGFYTSSNDGLRFLNKLISEGKIRPVIHRVYKFDEVPQAFDELSKGHLRGKIIIDFG